MKIVKSVGEKLLPSWLATELRPILVFTGTGAALMSGSVVLAVRAWGKLRERLSAWESVGAIAIGAYVTAYGCWHAPHITRFAAPGAAIAWCVAAWWAAPPPAREAKVEELDDEPEGELTLDELAAIVRRVAAHRQGAHLADVLQAPEMVGWTQSELKATAVDFGLPVEEFKLIFSGRQRVRDGIRVRDLPPAPAPTPPAAPPPVAPADPAPRPLSAPTLGPG